MPDAFRSVHAPNRKSSGLTLPGLHKLATACPISRVTRGPGFPRFTRVAPPAVHVGVTRVLGCACARRCSDTLDEAMSEQSHCTKNRLCFVIHQ